MNPKSFAGKGNHEYCAKIHTSVARGSENERQTIYFLNYNGNNYLFMTHHVRKDACNVFDPKAEEHNGSLMSVLGFRTYYIPKSREIFVMDIIEKTKGIDAYASSTGLKDALDTAIGFDIFGGKK